jgi:thioredoxin-related protein
MVPGAGDLRLKRAGFIVRPRETSLVIFMMQEQLRWPNDIKKAMDEAKRTNRLMLIFFHSNACSGCRATISKTLPDPKVSKFIGRMFVPTAFEVSDPRSGDLMKRYGFEWTPTFIVADAGGNEVYRWVGYLPPGDFCAEMLFAEGRAAFKDKGWDRAERCYSSVVDRFPDSEAAPEALYYTGVARYEKTHDASNLADANKKLQAKYPKSSWAKKASVWGE